MKGENIMTNYQMPLEVKEYFDNGCRTIKKVVPNEDYTLTLTFDNNEVRLYDMNQLIHKGVFKILEDKNKFKEAYLDDMGAVSWDIDNTIDSNTVWDNKIDLCPDSCYIYSKPL